MIFKFMLNLFVWFLRNCTSPGRHRQKPLHVASFMGLNNDNGAAFLVQSKPKLKTDRIKFLAWKFKLAIISGSGGGGDQGIAMYSSYLVLHLFNSWWVKYITQDRNVFVDFLTYLLNFYKFECTFIQRRHQKSLHVLLENMINNQRVMQTW